MKILKQRYSRLVNQFWSTSGLNGAASPLTFLVRGSSVTKKSGPCKQIGPTLEEISDEMANDIVVAKHNIDNEPNTPTKYGVRGIPTMLLFSGGELKATKVGATPKSDIVAWIKENI